MTKDIRIGVSALVAGVIAISGALSAQAADMPKRNPTPTTKYDYKPMSAPGQVPAQQPVYPSSSTKKTADWSGLYLGGKISYNWMKSSFGASTSSSSAEVVRNEFGTANLEGIAFGGQAGYNVQLDDNIIVGAEADFLWTDDLTLDTASKNAGNERVRFSTDVTWVAGLRARIGSAIDNYMVYGTGGVTFSDVKNTYQAAAATGQAAPAASSPAAKRLLGWAIGAGFEVLLSDNLTARLEYLYHNMNENTVSFGGSAAQSFDGGRDVLNNIKMHSARVGVNLKF